MGNLYNKGAILGWEGGLLSPKSADDNDVIGITLPYGDWDHINRITWKCDLHCDFVYFHCLNSPGFYKGHIDLL